MVQDFLADAALASGIFGRRNFRPIEFLADIIFDDERVEQSETNFQKVKFWAEN
jgi:hypothetical protein